MAGNCRTIICPYHSWTYGLDGALIGAPEMNQTEGFDPAQYGLVAVRLETWGGFIFANFDSEAPGLLDYLGDLTVNLAPYKTEEMACVRRRGASADHGAPALLRPPRPIFTIIDDSYGSHDTIGGCCSAPSNLLLYGVKDSPGCR